MRNSDLKKNIKNNQLTIGTWVTIPSIIIPDIYSKSNLDWICVDMEHTAISFSELQQLIISCEKNNFPVLVRVGDHNSCNIKKIMDIGASGIIAANVNKKEEAVALIQSLKYPKVGKRGLGLYRAQEFGDSIESYIKWNNDSSILIVQIETKESVKNISEILALNEIDALMVGPYDLSASLGCPGDFNSKEYKEALQKILLEANKNNITAGIHSVDPDFNKAVEKIHEGFKFISYSLDSILLKNSIELGINNIKKNI